MHDYSFHRGRKNFCRYCLHTIITEEILKRHIKDCFKINSKQTNKIPKESKYVKFKHFARKIKSPFTIYWGFEIILVPEDYRMQNPKESYYQQISKPCC